MSGSSVEADIIFNRASVALAKTQRLISTWLPPLTEEELRSAKTEEELETEEKEMFTAVPEVLGLGAPLPGDREGMVDHKRQSLSSNERLRRMLLGKDLAKRRIQGTVKDMNPVSGSFQNGSKPKPVIQVKVDDLSEEEEGRSGLGKSKRRRKEDTDPSCKVTSTTGVGGDGNFHEIVSQTGQSSSKRGGNYLDEVLAEKQSKKRKRRKINSGTHASSLV